MKKYELIVSQNGGEFYASVFIKGEDLELVGINNDTVEFNKFDLRFEYEHITSAKQVEFEECK